ncbi:recombinase family protein [Lysinibacillus macroides]|uniref:recombinase family protein n=1 Tax=Lysinibacillus macroides TaxID=33935 RepID=UPI0006B466F9|nr:recombinase family protein [Lysinibacillus macroides]
MANRMIGYCRVSTDEQNLELQEDSLARYAAEKDLELVLYTEKVTTRKNDRIELQNAMKAATSGDVFVVYKLDRLARSTRST